MLIVGAGIAGPTLAYWLARHGIRSTLIERAPALRTGGYVIDFWGAGFDVADRMGLVPELREKGYDVREVRMVGGEGETVASFSADVFGRMTAGRYTSLARSDLSAAIYGRLDDRVERVFGEDLLALEEDERGVRARLARSGERRFDLVTGADGLHSKVRALAFGDEPSFEKYLGYEVAAFEVEGYRPRDELAYVMYTEVGRQIARFAKRDDRALFLFVYTADDAAGPLPHAPEAQRARVRERFRGAGWETARILDAMERTDEIYLDRVSQIRMDAWARGRIALVGDAAFCVSLLAGQGSALAMIASYVLAGELAAARGDHARAFARYEERLRPLLEQKQRAAERFAGAFAPRTAVGLHFRNLVTRLLRFDFVADRAIGADLRDSFELPTYG